MANYRRGRINDEMQKELSALLREIKDPRVSGVMVSITSAQVTPDMKYATVYFSVLGGDPKETKKGLDSAKGFIRREIGKRIRLRFTPELSFVVDKSLDYSAHIQELLLKIEAEDKAKNAPETDNVKKEEH